MKQLSDYANTVEAQLNELELPTDPDLSEDQIEILLTLKSYEGGDPGCNVKNAVLQT